MTVFYDARSKGWRFDFQFQKRRFTSPRGFPTKAEARDAEAERRRILRRQAAGLETSSAADSPSFQDWAEVYIADLERRGRAIETAERTVRVVLRFFGRRPARPLQAHEAGPFHDYRLIDPIVSPAILDHFEAWMVERGIAGATRNRYRSAVSQLYAVAMRPRYRQATGVKENPMRGVERDTEQGRTVVLSLPQLRAILAQCSRHLWLTVMVAAMAPALRVGSILRLRWDQHIDADVRLITVAQHKTARRIGRPLVMPISDDLRRVLLAVRQTQRPDAKWVVTYRGRPVKTIDTGLKAACRAAGVPYGRAVPGGVTFHTLRHSALTFLAELGVPDALRKDAGGHTTYAMVQHYTHLAAHHLVEPLRQLADHLGVVGPVVELPPRRARRRAPQAPALPGASARDREKP
jgi:integrase